MSAILVVDDDPWYRRLLVEKLTQAGNSTREASSGAEAIARVREDRPALMLLDLAMPEMDGMATLEHIRTEHDAAALPVIMLTAYEETEKVVAALEQGANDFVSKEQPFPILLARVGAQRSLHEAFDQIRGLEQRLEQRNQTLERANEELARTNQRIQQSLSSAAKIQRMLLPESAPQRPQTRFAWRFAPCEELAGDTLNVLPLGDRYAGIYVLDVMGHGVPAALLAVMATRLLTPSAQSPSPLLEREGTPTRPERLTARLDEHFPWDERTGQFFTLLYGVLDCEEGILEYVSAGHPGPIRIARDGATDVSDAAGTPIGLGLEREHEPRQMRLEAGDRVYAFSDGVFEAMSPEGETFGTSRVVDALAGDRHAPLQESVDNLLKRLEDFCGAKGLRDDVSVVAVERDHAA